MRKLDGSNYIMELTQQEKEYHNRVREERRKLLFKSWSVRVNKDNIDSVINPFNV